MDNNTPSISLYDTLAKEIIRGLEGKNKGILTNTGFIDNNLSGITSGTYTLIGAEPGTGKTSFIDEIYLTSIYEYVKNNNLFDKIKIIYYSFEIKFAIKLAKLLCRKIYLDHGQYININTLLSRNRYSPSQDTLSRIDSYRTYFDDLGRIVTPHEQSMNGADMTGSLFELSRKFGKWKDDNPNGEYILDSDCFVLVIIDHIGLLKRNKFSSKKETIDDLSEYMVRLRNKCNFSFLITSQLNRDQSRRERQIKVKYGPQLSDFKDTGNTQEDADIVLGMYNPYKYKVDDFMGYNIGRMGSHFRSLHILKNRYGKENVSCGFVFDGGINRFTELPRSDMMKEEDYEKYSILST